MTQPLAAPLADAPSVRRHPSFRQLGPTPRRVSNGHALLSRGCNEYSKRGVGSASRALLQAQLAQPCLDVRAL